jgi:hypothetical protein
MQPHLLEKCSQGVILEHCYVSEVEAIAPVASDVAVSNDRIGTRIAIHGGHADPQAVRQQFIVIVKLGEKFGVYEMTASG